MISIIVLAAVFILIAVRRIGKIRFHIWQIMLLGAAAVLLTGQISPSQAFKAINFDIIIFLFCMFIVGEALHASGYLSLFSHRFFHKAKSFDVLLLMIIFGAGMASAFLMNDTLAIISTPVVLHFAVKARARPQMFLMALAFAVTIGSVMSPIGNPQNLLIAINGIDNPFVTFLRYLFLPTILNLALAFLFIRFYYRKQFSPFQIEYREETVTDPRLARLSRLALLILLMLAGVKIILVFLKVPFDFRLTYIALAAALPVVIFSPRRFSVVRRIDWSTLVFFTAMFVLMQSVWDSGLFQSFISRSSIDLTASGEIMAVSVVFSQFISNVPLVALYLPLLTGLGSSYGGMMALAAGSTIAGNLSILGAASNVIIIQNAEQKFDQTLSFLEFVKIGAPLTVLNVIAYWVFLTYV